MDKTEKNWKCWLLSLHFFCEMQWHSLCMCSSCTIAWISLLSCSTGLTVPPSATVNSPFFTVTSLLHIVLCLCLQLCRYNSREGRKKKEKRKKKQPAILLHHNHHGPFHMGESNFIIVPAGTVKTKLMNTESFLPWCVVSLRCRC